MGLLLMLGLALTAAPDSAPGTDAPSRTFNAPIDRVWAVTESVLKSLGWDIDKSNRAVGWIVTDSPGLEFKDYAVYGKGLRHKLRVALKTAGEGRTTVSVEGALHRGAHPLDDRAEARGGDGANRANGDPGRHPEGPVGGRCGSPGPCLPLAFRGRGTENIVTMPGGVPPGSSTTTRWGGDRWPRRDARASS